MEFFGDMEIPYSIWNLKQHGTDNPIRDIGRSNSEGLGGHSLGQRGPLVVGCWLG